MRLINADALEERKVPLYGPDVIIGKDIDTYSAYQLGWNDAIDAIIGNEPTVEAEPVRHGRWKGEGMGDYSCILCGEIVSGSDYKYCPHCGAKMDVERK